VVLAAPLGTAAPGLHAIVVRIVYKSHIRSFVRVVSFVPLAMSRRMYDIIFDLKFQAKQLNRSAQKCASNEKDKAFKAMQKNNMEGARIHAQNAIRLHNENLQFLRIASQYGFSAWLANR
jgi:hypothetical protein